MSLRRGRIRSMQRGGARRPQALRLFAQAPLAGDLNGACAELVDLRAFHGVVTLSLAAAATLRRMEEQRKADASTGGRVQAEPDMVRFKVCLFRSFFLSTYHRGEDTQTWKRTRGAYRLVSVAN